MTDWWVLVVMDQFTRRIVGFGVRAGDVDGVTLCRLFNQAISFIMNTQRRSSDNDLLIHYHQWQANLRILDIKKIKCIPYPPSSHPFIGGIDRNCSPGIAMKFHPDKCPAVPK